MKFYFFDVGQEEQERRFRARAADPMRHWKLSPMDVKSRQHWWDYTAAYQYMLDETGTDQAPWFRIHRSLAPFRSAGSDHRFLPNGWENPFPQGLTSCPR